MDKCGRPTMETINDKMRTRKVESERQKKKKIEKRQLVVRAEQTHASWQNSAMIIDRPSSAANAPKPERSALSQRAGSGLRLPFSCGPSLPCGPGAWPSWRIAQRALPGGRVALQKRREEKNSEERQKWSITGKKRGLLRGLLPIVPCQQRHRPQAEGTRDHSKAPKEGRTMCCMLSSQIRVIRLGGTGAGKGVIVWSNRF